MQGAPFKSPDRACGASDQGIILKIRAALTSGKGQPFELIDLELDEPRHDEILVEIRAVGLCHTDLVARDQVLPVPLPAVLGHEGAGIVVRTGAGVSKVRPGDRVVLTINSCGRCDRCRGGEPAYCETSASLNYAGCRADGSKSLHRDGQAVSSNFFGQSSFASHALAYEANTVRVDGDLGFELLAPLGCGVQTGAGAVLRALRCAPGSTIVITGGGAVGLSAVLAARIAGCATIIVSEPFPARRDLALELGATHVHDPMQGKLRQFVRSIVSPGCDYAIDTTGLGSVMDAALSSLRPRGVLGLLGVPPDPAQRSPGLAALVLSNGYTIRGIIEGDSEPDTFIPELIRLHTEGRFPYERLIQSYPFSELNRAVEDQLAGRVIKPVMISGV